MLNIRHLAQVIKYAGLLVAIKMVTGGVLKPVNNNSTSYNTIILLLHTPYTCMCTDSSNTIP